MVNSRGRCKYREKSTQSRHEIPRRLLRWGKNVSSRWHTRGVCSLHSPFGSRPATSQPGGESTRERTSQHQGAATHGNLVPSLSVSFFVFLFGSSSSRALSTGLCWLTRIGRCACYSFLRTPCFSPRYFTLGSSYRAARRKKERGRLSVLECSILLYIHNSRS